MGDDICDEALQTYNKTNRMPNIEEVQNGLKMDRLKYAAEWFID